MVLYSSWCTLGLMKAKGLLSDEFVRFEGFDSWRVRVVNGNRITSIIRRNGYTLRYDVTFVMHGDNPRLVVGHEVASVVAISGMTLVTGDRDVLYGAILSGGHVLSFSDYTEESGEYAVIDLSSLDCGERESAVRMADRNGHVLLFDGPSEKREWKLSSIIEVLSVQTYRVENMGMMKAYLSAQPASLDFQMFDRLLAETTWDDISCDDARQLLALLDAEALAMVRSESSASRIISLIGNGISVEVLKIMFEAGLWTRDMKEEFSSIVSIGYDRQDLGSLIALMLGACTDIGYDDVFCIVESFIQIASSFDNLLGRGYVSTHDTSSKECFEDLDEERCRQFDEFAHLLPPSVFWMRDCCGMTLLHHAARYLWDHRELVMLFSRILERTPDIDLVDEEGFTPLQYAGSCLRGMLIDRGADTDRLEASDQDMSNEKGRLRKLIENCRTWDEQPKCWLEDILDILARTMIDDERLWVDSMALMLSCEVFPQELCERLIALNPICVIGRGSDGRTALMAALDSEGEDIAPRIEWLVEHGAAAGIRDEDGSTVIGRAARRFHIGEVEWKALGLIKDRTPFTEPDNKGFTPVMAAFMHMNMPAVTFLMEHGYFEQNDVDYITGCARKIRNPVLREALKRLFVLNGLPLE